MTDKFQNQKDRARSNKIKILNQLKNNPSGLSFNNLRNSTNLHQNILNKWLSNRPQIFLKEFPNSFHPQNFQTLGYVVRVGDSKRKKYQITNEGIAYHNRLIAQENQEKILSNKDLIDSIHLTEIKVQTNQGKSICKTHILTSGILKEKSKEEIEEEFNKKISPKIVELLNEYKSTSGAITINYEPIKIKN